MRFLTADRLAHFSSVNVPIDEDLYSPTTTYGVGDLVYDYLTDQGNGSESDLGATAVYSSLQPDNVGNTPATSPTFWQKVSPTNRWAMRDATSGQVTTHDDDIVFEIVTSAAPYTEAISGFGFGFCVGRSVTVEVLDWDDPNADADFDNLAGVYHLNGGLSDAAGKLGNISTSDAALSSAQSKFGGSSLLFGSSGRATIPSASSLNLQGDEFCHEFFVFPTTSASVRCLLSQGDPATGAFVELVIDSDNYLSARLSSTDEATGVDVTLSSSSVVSANAWHAIRLSRVSDTWQLFLDGSRVSSTTGSHSLDLSGDGIVLGQSFSGGKQFQGYVDEIRLTSGIGRDSGSSYSVTNAEFLDSDVSLPAAKTVMLNNETIAQTEAVWNGVFGDNRKQNSQAVLIAFDELEGYLINPTIRVTVEKGASYRAMLGAVAWGGGLHQAVTSWGVTVGMTDYSVKKVNDFGVVEFIRRPYAPKISAELEIAKELVDAVVPTLAWVRARPVFWDFNNAEAGDSAYQSLYIVGFFTDFEMEMVDVEHFKISLDIEGMI